MTQHPQLAQDWLEDFSQHSTKNTADNPNYYISTPSDLLTTSTPISFTLGTGAQLLSRIATAAETATRSVILTTCFWHNPSPSQELIRALLVRLSQRAQAISPTHRIAVRICFSSLSLTQKLLHTASPDGRIWEPAEWVGRFGLPAPEEMPGVELVVKSLFFRPFSVMHPKFLVVDASRAWVMSCNVSWEEWFEGSVELEGDVVTALVRFWRQFWRLDDGMAGVSATPPSTTQISGVESGRSSSTPQSRDCLYHTAFTNSTIPTILLPSPHHRNPSFRPHPLTTPAPPPTPLNTFLLLLVKSAKSTIYIQTPNLTSAPIITALLSALARGVDIHVTTSSRLMILEQLVTAGTTTELSVWGMKRQYQALLRKDQQLQSQPADLETGVSSSTAPRSGSGRLKIDWYKPRDSTPGAPSAEAAVEHEPVKSHLKLMVMDGEVVVLGSGNLDRASWYTSQELGVAFFDREVASKIMEGVRVGLLGRVVS